MAKKIVRALRCKNYESHMIEQEKNPLTSTPIFIRENMATHYGWQKIGNEWLCPECIKAADNWGNEGDMV